MKKLTLLLSLALVLGSCASMKLSELRPSNRNEALLPTLEPIVDMYTLESIYSMEYISDRSMTYTTDTYPVGLGISFNNQVYSRDRRVQDILTLFDREVKDNITNPFGEKRGYIVCKIAGGYTGAGGIGWTILSGLTMFIPNIFGMPLENLQTMLDVEVEIYDLNDKLIGRYNGQGYSKVWVAMFYGYSTDIFDEYQGSASRISNIRAFKQAMNVIKANIAKDHDVLSQKLNQYNREE